MITKHLEFGADRGPPRMERHMAKLANRASHFAPLSEAYR